MFLTFLDAFLRPPPRRTIAPAPRVPAPELLAVKVCADCAFYDPRESALPICHAAEFVRDPITGEPNRGQAILCHVARSTSLCGVEAARFLPREARS